jgi:hypothetical protein
MLSYKEHFASQRADGRHVSTVAATMAMLRDLQPELALPKDLTAAGFSKWQTAVKERHRQLLCLPQATPQPEPVMLSCVQRSGYRVEKWEFYPVCHYVDVEDHSFRPEPSIALLKKCFAV